MMTYEQIVQAVPMLSVEERKRLISTIVDSLAELSPPPKKRSILEFEGIAARLADDEDPQDHVRHLRDEWDKRP